MSGINIGNLQTDEDVQIGEINIPVITPKRGIDYWTPSDKQEVVDEAIDAVNAVVMPQEQTRQNNEETRQNNEATRQENEATRQANEAERIENETAREERFAEYEAIIDGVEDDLEEMQGDLSDIQAEQTTQNTNISANASAIETLQANKMDKSDIPSIDNLTNYYKKSETYNKTEIDGKVSSVYKYKGTVATYQDLPSTDLTIGDVYNVEEDGSNYAWTGNSWDKLGGDIDLSEYYTKTQTDSLLSAKANSSDVYNKTETYNKTEVNTLLDGKVDKEQGKGLSEEDYTTPEKTKLAGIEAEANKTIVDSSLDDTSTNPVQNKVIYESQEEQNAEIETLQNQVTDLEQDVEDLRGACLSVEGTGTDITLNNTAKCRLLRNDLSGRTEQEQLSGSNQFNASAISNSNIQVLDNGKTIKMPINSSGNGYTSTSSRFYDLCPNLEVGDIVYLYFTRSQELQLSNLVYFEQAEITWLNNTSIEITEAMLNSYLILYGNRAVSGETEQISLTDFRIVRTQNTPWEQFCGRNTKPKPRISTTYQKCNRSS